MAAGEQKVEAAVGKVFGELAATTGTVERYVREWLRGVAVAGYVGYEPADGTFVLSKART